MYEHDNNLNPWSSIAAREVGSVLLQRAPTRQQRGRSLLFSNPYHVVEAWQPNEVAQALARVDSLLAQGFYLAGYVAYEAGFALEPSLRDLSSCAKDGVPLVWLGCYRSPQIREDSLPLDFIGPSAPPIQLEYSLAPEAYEQQVELARQLIARGETYQLNLTMHAEWLSEEPTAALYERLLRAQPVPYAALLHPHSDWHILSLSPELFLQRTGDHIRTRPMKGTASPGLDSDENRAQVTRLRSSEKERAENVMIVDLLRSDLGRICQVGSVNVTRLFEVERYPTVLQMISEIEGQLRERVSYSEIFTALFPSGSIVGAPKIHSMRLLHGIERKERGVYTGAIGYMSPHSEAEFNVAIRTVSLKKGSARLGVGAGITYGSDPVQEYAECLTKTAFLRRDPEPAFELIETFLLKDETFFLLEEHLARLAQSAEYFGFIYEEQRVRSALQEVARNCTHAERTRVRLLVDSTGALTCTATPLPLEGSASVSLLLSKVRTSPYDRFLRHKTTHRAPYDTAIQLAQTLGFADQLFQNTRDELTEGAIHNLIVSMAGEWFTPPLSSGVLPGVYRESLLRAEKVSERVLLFSDLLKADEVFVCNSVQGLRRVTNIAEQTNDSEELINRWVSRSVPASGGI